MSGSSSLVWGGKFPKLTIHCISHYRCTECDTIYSTLFKAKEHIAQCTNDDLHGLTELRRVATAIEAAPCSFDLMDTMINTWRLNNDESETLLDCEHVSRRPWLRDGLDADPFWPTVMAEVDANLDDPQVLKKVFLMKNLLFDCASTHTDEQYTACFNHGVIDVQQALCIQPVSQPLCLPRRKTRRDVIVAAYYQNHPLVQVRRPLF